MCSIIIQNKILSYHLLAPCILVSRSVSISIFMYFFLIFLFQFQTFNLFKLTFIFLNIFSNMNRAVRRKAYRGYYSPHSIILYCCLICMSLSVLVLYFCTTIYYSVKYTVMLCYVILGVSKNKILPIGTNIFIVVNC